MSGDGKNSESPTVERVFELLDRWRHLPTYQLERRADVFFALFLPEVLGRHFKHLEIEIDSMIIPEFPILLAGLEDILMRHGPPRKKPLGFQSNRVDYFAYSPKSAHSFLVELKTDMSSITSPEGKKQKELLVEAAKRRELKKLVCDVIDISKSKYADKQKYIHLLWRLSVLGLVEGVNERISSLYENAAPVAECDPDRHRKASIRGKKLAKELRGVKPAEISWPEVKLVYIQPRQWPDEGGRDVIDFKKFAKIIEECAKEMGESDGIRHTFACYLKKWAADEAGSPNPKDSRSC